MVYDQWDRNQFVTILKSRHETLALLIFGVKRVSNLSSILNCYTFLIDIIVDNSNNAISIFGIGFRNSDAITSVIIAVYPKFPILD